MHENKTIKNVVKNSSHGKFRDNDFVFNKQTGNDGVFAESCEVVFI